MCKSARVCVCVCVCVCVSIVVHACRRLLRFARVGCGALRRSEFKRLVVKVHTPPLVVARGRLVPEVIHHAARATCEYERRARRKVLSALVEDRREIRAACNHRLGQHRSYTEFVNVWFVYRLHRCECIASVSGMLSNRVSSLLRPPATAGVFGAHECT